MSAFGKANGLFKLLFACMVVLFSACGDSGSSSTNDDPEDVVRPAKEIDVDNKVSSSRVYRDRFYDPSTGSYVNTVQFGMYVWLL